MYHGIISKRRSSVCGTLRRVAIDIVADAEGPPVGSQDDNVDRLVVVRLDQSLGDGSPQLMIDGVELLGPVHRDDGDIAVRLVLHEIVGHASSPACSRGNNGHLVVGTQSCRAHEVPSADDDDLEVIVLGEAHARM
jgi:hypothetical protein